MCVCAVALAITMLFALHTEDLGVHSPQSESTEDSYITATSVAPSAVYSSRCPTLLIGSSVEAIILDLIKQVEVCQTT